MCNFSLFKVGVNEFPKLFHASIEAVEHNIDECVPHICGISYVIRWIASTADQTFFGIVAFGYNHIQSWHDGHSAESAIEILLHVPSFVFNSVKRLMHWFHSIICWGTGLEFQFASNPGNSQSISTPSSWCLVTKSTIWLTKFVRFAPSCVAVLIWLKFNLGEAVN